LSRNYLLIPLFILLQTASASQAQQVYFGVADQWADLVQRPEEWRFVQQNADGLYINFIELNWDHADLLKATAQLFAHKNVYIESDMGYAWEPGVPQRNGETPAEADQRYIHDVQDAGFKISYTSLNYGWSQDRANNLGNFDLKGESPRPCFVQHGPWNLDNPQWSLNAGRMAQINAAPGISTDGPIGFWKNDFGQMRENSLKLVNIAHAARKKAVIMICPYGAGNTSYSTGQFLGLGEDEVRYFEDASVLPDVWAIFEYATDIPAVPEELKGVPANTTSGMAYWLLKHLHDPDHAARLETDQKESSAMVWHVTLRNQSGWLDLAPLLQLRITDPHGAFDVTFTLDGRDITAEATKGDGLALTGSRRLWAGSQHQLILIVKTRPNRSLEGAAAGLRLAPNIALPGEIDQSIQLWPVDKQNSTRP
jgi:hypothetical protein